MNYIRQFADLRMTDIGLVGGKNAALGQMISQLAPQGIEIPHGFAVTAQAYWYVLEKNNLLPELKKIVGNFTDLDNLKQLQEVGARARSLIEQATLPEDLVAEITQAYKNLCAQYDQEQLDVAVRSSATAEDLPGASFAGQQETFLNVTGVEQLLSCVSKSMASLFTNRAIIYRMRKGFDHFQVALSVGVQKMVRSDLAVSGVSFSIDTESGFTGTVVIDASYGLGDTIVQGMVVPDEYYVHKPTLKKGFRSLIKKTLGSKKIKRVYSGEPNKLTQDVEVPWEQQHLFCLSDDEVLQLAQYTVTIEDYYTQLNKQWSPMDVEWAKDGIDGKLYIIQARPETVHALRGKTKRIVQYQLHDGEPHQLRDRLIITGQSIGQQIASGVARIVDDPSQIEQVKQGDILITHMTDPDWVPIMKRAAAIITNSGGRTCHAAIVSRELGIPALVGTHDATQVIAGGQKITVDCSKGKTGYVYDGIVPFTTVATDIGTIPKLGIDVLINTAMPDAAFDLSFLPVNGVGLARIEFIISNLIGIHPMAIAHLDEITDKKVHQQIIESCAGYDNPHDYFVSVLAQGIATIAAAFYPRPVTVRLSDFKTNEYTTLLGGQYFEPVEENPMIGFRGAIRYYHEKYREAFALECEAFKKVRADMGLTNVQIMVPFVRTLTEADRVIHELSRHGLKRGRDELKIIMMCEVPSNVILLDEFAQHFDGFSIGSNDLAQLVLSADRDSPLLAGLFDERDPAVKKVMCQAIQGAHRNSLPISICGQAPSDYPELAEFLLECGIDAISLNPDVVLQFMMDCRKCRV